MHVNRPTEESDGEAISFGQQDLSSEGGRTASTQGTGDSRKLELCYDINV